MHLAKSLSQRTTLNEERMPVHTKDSWQRHGEDSQPRIGRRMTSGSTSTPGGFGCLTSISVSEPVRLDTESDQATSPGIRELTYPSQGSTVQATTMMLTVSGILDGMRRSGNLVGFQLPVSRWKQLIHTALDGADGRDGDAVVLDRFILWFMQSIRRHRVW